MPNYQHSKHLKKLEKYFNDILNIYDYCAIKNCENKQYHKTIAHKCKMCNQFGHDIDLCDFIYNEIKCPLCREINNIKASQTKIKGLESKCVICMDKDVEIYFNKCGHVCVCSDCIYSLCRSE